MFYSKCIRRGRAGGGRSGMSKNLRFIVMALILPILALVIMVLNA